MTCTPEVNEVTLARGARVVVRMPASSTSLLAVYVVTEPGQEPGRSSEVAFADLTSEIASPDHAPAAFKRLRDANTMKILIAPNSQ